MNVAVAGRAGRGLVSGLAGATLDRLVGRVPVQGAVGAAVAEVLLAHPPPALVAGPEAARQLGLAVVLLVGGDDDRQLRHVQRLSVAGGPRRAQRQPDKKASCSS